MSKEDTRNIDLPKDNVPLCNGGGCNVAYKCNYRRGTQQCYEHRMKGS